MTTKSLKEIIRMNLNDLMSKRSVRNIELADAVGVSKAAVTNWKKGTNSVDLELLPVIADYLGVSVQRMMTDPEENGFYPIADIDGIGVDEAEENLRSYELQPGQRLSITYPDDRELLSLWHRMDSSYREMLLKTAAAYVEMTEKDRAGSEQNAGRVVTR